MIKRLDSPQIRRSCLAGRQVHWSYLCWRRHGDESQNPRLFTAFGVFGSHRHSFALARATDWPGDRGGGISGTAIAYSSSLALKWRKKWTRGRIGKKSMAPKHQIR